MPHPITTWMPSRSRSRRWQLPTLLSYYNSMAANTPFKCDTQPANWRKWRKKKIVTQGWSLLSHTPGSYATNMMATLAPPQRLLCSFFCSSWFALRSERATMGRGKSNQINWNKKINKKRGLCRGETWQQEKMPVQHLNVPLSTTLHTGTQALSSLWEVGFPLISFLSQRKTTLLNHNSSYCSVMELSCILIYWGLSILHTPCIIC